MTPYYSDAWLTVYGGDCRAVMAEMPEASVHCVVTSPPYWGLRDYGNADQLGLEATPEAYVANMVAVFREVRRVLRDDGTVWLNLGDSYASGEVGRVDALVKAPGLAGTQKPRRERRIVQRSGLKPKDLVGIPWRVAFALQADGWYLRSDIIWAKPNPMPESVTDRPTKAHEYLFLLSKGPRYYFDADAVREAAEPWNSAKGFTASGKRGAGTGYDRAALNQFNGTGTHEDREQTGRNLRSVWTIATAPYPGAHFATFPPKLVEPCVKAGTSERGVCPECGAPWLRVVERTPFELGRERERNAGGRGDGFSRPPGGAVEWARRVEPQTTGWRPSCVCCEAGGFGCDPHRAVPATVLDPFAGSGTALMVAQSLSRRAIGIDLNPDYLAQCLARNSAIPLGLEAS